jgi:ATP-dependent protease ClpP protease subunit
MNLHIGGEIRPGLENELVTLLHNMKVSGESDLLITINSLGGNLHTAVAAYTILKESGINVTTRVIGACESAAVLIFLAGRKRSLAKNTSIMIHAPARSHNDRL